MHSIDIVITTAATLRVLGNTKRTVVQTLTSLDFFYLLKILKIRKTTFLV